MFLGADNSGHFRTVGRATSSGADISGTAWEWREKSCRLATRRLIETGWSRNDREFSPRGQTRSKFKNSSIPFKRRDSAGVIETERELESRREADRLHRRIALAAV